MTDMWKYVAISRINVAIKRRHGGSYSKSGCSVCDYVSAYGFMPGNPTIHSHCINKDGIKCPANASCRIFCDIIDDCDFENECDLAVEKLINLRMELEG